MKKTLIFAAMFAGAATAVLPSLHAEESQSTVPAGPSETVPRGNNDDVALRHWRMAERMKLEDRIYAMGKTLSLTDDQKISLRAAYEDLINKTSDLRAKFINESQALEMSEDEKITSALTPEQKAKYPEAKAKMLSDEHKEEMEKHKGENGEGGEGSKHGNMGGGFGGGGHGGGHGGPGGF